MHFSETRFARAGRRGIFLVYNKVCGYFKTIFKKLLGLKNITEVCKLELGGKFSTKFVSRC